MGRNESCPPGHTRSRSARLCKLACYRLRGRARFSRCDAKPSFASKLVKLPDEFALIREALIRGVRRTPLLTDRCTVFMSRLLSKASLKERDHGTVRSPRVV